MANSSAELGETSMFSELKSVCSKCGACENRPVSYGQLNREEISSSFRSLRYFAASCGGVGALFVLTFWGGGRAGKSPRRAAFVEARASPILGGARRLWWRRVPGASGEPDRWWATG